MRITLIKQYSVFLINNPGELKKFTDIFAKENINILAISQDVRSGSAVVRLAIDSDSEQISHSITKEGFTSVKTDALCLEFKNHPGILRDITAVLASSGINIISIYGSTCGESSRLVIIPNDTEKAMELLEKSGFRE
jgi:hypothetical protein